MRVLILNLFVLVGISFLTSSNAQDFSPRIWNHVPGLKKEVLHERVHFKQGSPNEYLIKAIKGDLWDNELEEWFPLDSIEYSWNEDSELSERINLFWVNQAWEYYLRTTNTYNDNDQLVLSLEESWADSIWTILEYNNKRTYVYEGNNEVYHLTQFWNEGQWLDRGSRTTSYFLGTDLVDTIVEKRDIITVGELSDFELINYESYTDDGLPTIWYVLKWHTGNMDWGNLTRYQITYDGEGREFFRHVSILNNGNWDDHRRYFYTYNNNGQQSEIRLQVWSVLDQEWRDEHLIEYEYNEAGDMTVNQMSRYEEEYEGLHLYFTGTLTYDEEGKLISYLEQDAFFSEELVNNTYIEYTYYEDIGAIASSLQMNWNDSDEAWKNYRKVVMYYYDISTDDKDLIIPEANIIIMPNPSDEIIQITLDEKVIKNEGINAELINAMGGVKKQFIIRASSHQLDVSNLVAGVYWIKFSIGQYTYTKQVVIF